MRGIEKNWERRMKEMRRRKNRMRDSRVTADRVTSPQADGSFYCYVAVSGYHNLKIHPVETAEIGRYANIWVCPFEQMEFCALFFVSRSLTGCYLVDPLGSTW